jgi:hypothetical protein
LRLTIAPDADQEKLDGHLRFQFAANGMILSN